MSDNEKMELLVSLQDAVARLNTSADKATKRIRTVEDVLDKINVRYEVWLDHPFYKNCHLGYGQTQTKAYNILYRRQEGEQFFIHEPEILKDAPRLIRIKGAAQLDELQRALLVAVKSELAEAAMP